jgi:hypothetical protein
MNAKTQETQKTQENQASCEDSNCPRINPLRHQEWSNTRQLLSRLSKLALRLTLRNNTSTGLDPTLTAMLKNAPENERGFKEVLAL